MNDKTNPSKQEVLLHKDNLPQTSDTNEPPRGLFGRLKAKYHDSKRGIRAQREIIEEHEKLFDTTARTLDSLHQLETTPRRLQREDAQAQRAEAQARRAEVRAQRDHKAALKDHELAMKEKEISLERLKKKETLVADEHTIERDQLALRKAILKKELQQEKKDDKEDDDLTDPEISRARRDIRRHKEIRSKLQIDKEKDLAEIDEQVASGEISKEDAEEIKEELEQMYRRAVLDPER